jgi:hypothetical protein
MFLHKRIEMRNGITHPDERLVDAFFKEPRSYQQNGK